MKSLEIFGGPGSGNWGHGGYGKSATRGARERARQERIDRPGEKEAAKRFAADRAIREADPRSKIQARRDGPAIQKRR